MTVVQNILKDPAGQPLGNVRVSISLVTSGWVSGGAYEIITSSIVTTDATGLWTVTLTPNASIDPAGTYYIVRQPGGETLTFTVPATGTYWLHDVLVVTPASPASALPVVLYTPQTLDAGQQAQAQANLGITGSAAPTGPAGGVLGGTYPNPGFAVDMATQAELDASASSHLAAADPHPQYLTAAEGDVAIATKAVRYDAAQALTDAQRAQARANLDTMRLGLPASLNKWRRGLARVRANAGDAKILCVGDSIMFGPNPPATLSIPAQLATILGGTGIPVARGLAVPPTLPDPRWTNGNQWSVLPTFGWGDLAAWTWTSNAAPNNVVYADTVNCDRFDVYYARVFGLGSATATATGGAGVGLPAGAPNAVVKVTANAAAAATTNTLTIAPNASSGPVYILGVEPWLSTTSKVRIANAGVSGSKAQQWATGTFPNVYDSAACIKLYAPDLTIIQLGINDATAGNRTPAQYIADIQALITAAQVSGDVILCSMIPPTSGVSGGAATLSLINQFEAQLAAQSLPYVSSHARWVSGDNANTLGLMYDAIHPNATGYADLAQMIASALVSAQ